MSYVDKLPISEISFSLGRYLLKQDINVNKVTIIFYFIAYDNGFSRMNRTLKFWGFDAIH